MKQTSRILLVVLAIAAVLFVRIGHVSAAQISEPSSSNSQAIEATFTGVIEKMDGNQWIVAGKTVSIDPALAATGTFAVGDTVKVEGFVQADGSIRAKSVELPSGTPDNSNSSNDNSVNNGNSNDSSVGNANDNGNSNESEVDNDHGNSNSDGEHSNRNSNESHDDPSKHDQGHDNSNSSNDNSSNSNDSNSNNDNSNNG